MPDRLRALIKIITLAFIVVLFYHLCIRPLNWHINNNEVEAIYLNDEKVHEENYSNIVKKYNSISKIKKRRTMEGSTPEFVFKIQLKSGEIISIEDDGIISKTKGKKYVSYWGDCKSMFKLVKEKAILNSKNNFEVK